MSGSYSKFVFSLIINCCVIDFVCSSNSHSPSPPSSSNAFSLLSASSEQDNPSTSGCRFVNTHNSCCQKFLLPCDAIVDMCVPYICSSEESAKAKTQKELIKTLKELKLHLPADKRNKGSKSTTLNTLKYALRCVKQVEGEQNMQITYILYIQKRYLLGF